MQRSDSTASADGRLDHRRAETFPRNIPSASRAASAQQFSPRYAAVWFHSDSWFESWLVLRSIKYLFSSLRPDDGIVYSSYPGRIKSLKAGDSGRRQIPPGLRDDAAADDLPLEALARRGSNTSQKSSQSVQSLGGMDSLNSSTSGTLQGLVRAAQRNLS